MTTVNGKMSEFQRHYATELQEAVLPEDGERIHHRLTSTVGVLVIVVGIEQM